MSSSAEELDPADRAAEVEGRLGWLRSLLTEPGARGVLLHSRASFAWATLGGLNHVVVGAEGGAVPLLVTGQGAWALAPINEAGRIADEEVVGLPIQVHSVPWEDPAAVAFEAERLAGGTILSEVDLGDVLQGRRSQLISAEHARMRSLSADIATTMDRALGDVQRGDTEHEVGGRVAGELLAKGIRAPVLLAAADERIERYRHPLPTSRPVRRRLMAVAVGERWGLHAAVTRFIDLEPPSAELQRRAAATAEVLEAMRAATRPGETLGGVLAAAREAYGAVGFDHEWLLHHQGGTIGYAPRERIATPADETALRPGMAVAWNPSIAGTKLEATMIVTEGEPEELPR
ncbi:MAG: M24 family metallopeptidase [Candidatus Limnocylindrales bacterium]